jgi:hypothetical protein
MIMIICAICAVVDGIPQLSNFLHERTRTRSTLRSPCAPKLQLKSPTLIPLPHFKKGALMKKTMKTEMNVFLSLTNGKKGSFVCISIDYQYSLWCIVSSTLSYEIIVAF